MDDRQADGAVGRREAGSALGARRGVGGQAPGRIAAPAADLVGAPPPPGVAGEEDQHTAEAMRISGR
jgi:hypothetical protein